MKFRLKWTGLDYCMGYTKKLPKKIRKIKVTKTTASVLMKSPLHAPVVLQCGRWLTLNAPHSGDPMCITLFQLRATPDVDAAVMCSHGQRLNPRPQVPHCWQGADPGGSGSLKPVPSRSCRLDDSIKKNAMILPSRQLTWQNQPPQNDHLLSSPDSDNLNANKKGWRPRKI